MVRIATQFMFKSHVYTFAGKFYKQQSGGSIGLRGTCAIARLIMQMWDHKWLEVMDRVGVQLELAMRDMDDGRVFLFPLKAGWRWREGELLFCKRWELEDSHLTPTERTRRVIHESMMGVESFLKFTMETVEEFGGEWLPTLDTELQVREDNRVLYRFYEKPVATNMTVQFASAMEENNKMKTLANDLTRRLLNMSEDMSIQDKVLVINNYSTKLATSGYSTNQIQRIIVNGIKA